MTLFTSKYYRTRYIPDLTGKTAIVTGANTGIGYSTARELARKGAKVVIGCRNDKRGRDAVARIKQELKGLPGADLVEYIQLDLGNFNSVRSFASSFKGRHQQLHMLILNAGIMIPPFSLTDSGFESQIGVNHFGHFLLTNTLKNVLKRTKGRVVAVSSMGHIVAQTLDFDTFTNGTNYHAFSSYAQSKLANVLFCNEFARRMTGTGVTCNSLHPGSIRTELSRHVEEDLKKSLSARFMSFLEVLVTPFLMNSDDGALTQLYVATAHELEGVTGRYYTPTGRFILLVSYSLTYQLIKSLCTPSHAYSHTPSCAHFHKSSPSQRQKDRHRQ